MVVRSRGEPPTFRFSGELAKSQADLVRSIGADKVIDYTREDFADGRQHYDLILDIGGNSRLSRLRRALTPKGTLVIAGGEGRWTGVGRRLRALALSPVIPQRLTMFVSGTNKRQADLQTLRQHIEAGRLTPIVGDTYPLPQVPEAIRHPKAVAPKENRHHHLKPAVLDLDDRSASTRSCRHRTGPPDLFRLDRPTSSPSLIGRKDAGSAVTKQHAAALHVSNGGSGAS